MRRRLIAALALVSAAMGVRTAAAQVVMPPIGFAARQALESAYPQVGIAAAGGSPVLGTEGTRGITLGFIPKTTGTLRLNAARLRLPDLRSNESLADVRTSVVTVVKLETATRLYDGIASGTATGIGSLDLLLDAGVVPGTGDLHGTGTEVGGGARLGLLRETFGTPGVALSAMVRHTSRLRYGDGDNGASIEFPVTDLSSRLTVGKRVGPVGLLGGVGWDRFSTRGSAVYRYLSQGPAELGAKLDDSRWALFGDVAWALPVGSLVVEGGWMSGGDATFGYDPDTHRYDPRDGTVFGSLGLRISL
jgi:hypothetical protein